MREHSGLLTDLYELTMAAGYFEGRFDGRATFELFVRHLPPHRNYLVAAGLEPALEYLENALRLSLPNDPRPREALEKWKAKASGGAR